MLNPPAHMKGQISGAITKPVYLLEIEAGDGQEPIYLHNFGRHAIAHDGITYQPGLLGHNKRDRSGGGHVMTVGIDNSENQFDAHVGNTARPEDRKIHLKKVYGEPPWPLDALVLDFTGAIKSVGDVIPDLVFECSTEKLFGQEAGMPLEWFCDALVQPGTYAFGGQYYELEREN